MVQFLAFSLQDQVEKYGAYIGIAAFFGLAVLTILYFSQARELRRLRDWAGRAPERAQEIEARAIAQAEAQRRIQAEPVRRTPAPATASAAAGGAATATPAGEQATQVVEPVEGAGQSGNGTAAAAAGQGEQPEAEQPDAEAGAEQAEAEAEPAVTAGESDEPTEAKEDEPEAAAPSETSVDEPETPSAAPETDAAAAPGDHEAAPAAPGDHESAPAAPAEGGGAELPEREAAPANGRPLAPPEPGEIPVAPVPRATPLPRRAPAPAAPLRQPSRSATLPPRRPTPRRAPAPARGGGSRMPIIGVGLGVIALAAIALFATGIVGGGDDPAPAPDTTAAPSAQPTEAPSLTAATTKVAVLNGTTIPGLAGSAAETLTEAGYTGEVTSGDNDDQTRVESTVYFGARPGARTQARNVGQELEIDTLERMDADLRDLSEGADVAVILGQDKAP